MQPGYPPQPMMPQPYAQGQYPAPGYPQPMSPPGYPMGYGAVSTVSPVAQAVGMLPMPMQAMPVMAPGAPIGQDLISTLGMQQGLFIKQDLRLLEAIGLCEQNNRYSVEPWNPAAGKEPGQVSMGRFAKDQPLFRFKERSDWCARQLCHNRRAFEMAFYPLDPRIPTSAQAAATQDPFMCQDSIILERPFRCTVACLWRSIVRVKHPGLGYLGEIFNPFTWCNWVFEVRTPTPFDEPTAGVSEWAKSKGAPGTVLYRVRGELCQWGMLLPPLPVGECSRVVFTIHHPGDEAFTRPLGSINKVWSGCLREMVSEADNYTVTFPPDADPIGKALLTSAAMLIDMLLFEATGDKHDNNGLNVVSMLT